MGAKVTNNLSGGDGGFRRVPLVTRDSITASQVSTLLQVTGTLLSFLAMSSRSDDAGVGTALDGGVRSSVESTVINACHRLDILLENDSRWNLAVQELLETKAAEMMQLNIQNLKVQHAQLSDMSRPSVQHPPKLLKLPDGKWMALFGSPDQPETMILGVGDSPESALESFDRVFLGQPAPEVIAWLSEKSNQKRKRRKPNTPDE